MYPPRNVLIFISTWYVVLRRVVFGSELESRLHTACGKKNVRCRALCPRPAAPNTHPPRHDPHDRFFAENSSSACGLPHRPKAIAPVPVSQYQDQGYKDVEVRARSRGSRNCDDAGGHPSPLGSTLPPTTDDCFVLIIYSVRIL